MTKADEIRGAAAAASVSKNRPRLGGMGKIRTTRYERMQLREASGRLANLIKQHAIATGPSAPGVILDLDDENLMMKIAEQQAISLGVR